LINVMTVSNLSNQLALPHELNNLPRVRGRIPNQIDFGFARLPEALPLLLISRKLGMSRWQL
jgi:hypothetical protein